MDKLMNIITRIFSRVSNTFMNVQILLYLNGKEKEKLLTQLNDINNKYSNNINSKDNDNILISMIEDITVSIMRLRHCIIAGSFTKAIKGSSRRQFNKIDDIYNFNFGASNLSGLSLTNNEHQLLFKNNKKVFIEMVDNYCKLSLIKIDHKTLKNLF